MGGGVEVTGCRRVTLLNLWFAKVTIVPEDVEWVVNKRWHSQRGFWKGKTNAGPSEE